MLHPSYSDLMKVVNSEVEEGEAPVVNSRYSIVMAASYADCESGKPLSTAIEELNESRIKILNEEA